MNKIWFLCNRCYKYNSLEATPYLVDYYQDLETSYCPTCDEEESCEIRIGIRPLKPLSIDFLYE